MNTFNITGDEDLRKDAEMWRTVERSIPGDALDPSMGVASESPQAEACSAEGQSSRSSRSQ